jgi:hypothetical protein
MRRDRETSLAVRRSAGWSCGGVEAFRLGVKPQKPLRRVSLVGQYEPTLARPT